MQLLTLVPQAPNRKRLSSLFLELLETRCLPSTVTSLSDSGPGSLRDAIATTPGGGTVDFQTGLSGTITLTTGELAISKNLAIEGPGADVITVSGNKASRVFNLANFTVAISGLTIADGQSPNGRNGGGIYNAGTLTITASTFSGNPAEYNGGGIYNENGTLTITASTFSSNSAKYGYGGGIDNIGTLTITASTFSGNSADNNNLYGGGGGIYNYPSAFFRPGTVKIRNTLVAENGVPDVMGVLTSLGHNLIGDGSGSGYVATDLVGTFAKPINPKLGLLQDNGGPTWTLALLHGSPAIGAGGPTDSEWDQRGPGYARSANGMTDIGAYEVQPSGAGAASLAIHFPEPTHLVPVITVGEPPRPSVPLRPAAAAAVEQVFGSWSSEATGLVAGRSKRADGTEPLLWAVDQSPVSWCPQKEPDPCGVFEPVRSSAWHCSSR
jgi:hypothetical protein